MTSRCKPEMKRLADPVGLSEWEICAESHFSNGHPKEIVSTPSPENMNVELVSLERDVGVVANGLPPLPAGMKPLGHQLAGHKFGAEHNKDMYGMLESSDGTILKPVASRKGLREKFFYQLLAGDYQPNDYYSRDLYISPLIMKLKDFVPTFLGIRMLPEHPTVPYVHLVDMTKAYRKPITLDVKIGAKAWAPDASPEKQRRQKGRCPHIDEIRFQVLGARYYDAISGEPVVKLDFRHQSPLTLSKSGLPDIFQALPGPLKETCIKQINEQLHAIEKWFENQRQLAFYGSSVLIVFEADLSNYHSGINELTHANPKVRMIDFVHVWETSSRDGNYIDGIVSLQKYLSQIVDHC